ncbi:hypothetical protein V8C37DRAFT_390902 [Trichoderma ceciliae]
MWKVALCCLGLHSIFSTYSYTGASGGIGKACAEDLRRQGIHLALTYSSSKGDVDRLVDELNKMELPERFGRPRVSAHQADVAASKKIGRLFDEIKTEHGQLASCLIFYSRMPAMANAFQSWKISALMNGSIPFAST